MGLLIMACSEISDSGCSDILVMNRGLTSKQGGYSQTSYISPSNRTIILYMEPDWLFMQDNARIHTARKLKG